jgi:zinc D-Ala-D-Ala carboxypeptidase
MSFHPNPFLQRLYDNLGIQSSHLAANRLSPNQEPALAELEVVAIDFEGKPFVLIRAAAAAWRKLVRAAQADGVVLEPFSGFRSYVYQCGLIRRKLDAGKPLEVILTETAIPGFSEHHTGRAVDICTDNVYKLNWDFEKTAAFTWLMENAGRFSFRLSYPRGNDMGIIFEPWHWYFHGED